MTIAAVAVADYFEDSRPFARLLMENVDLADTQVAPKAEATAQA